MTPEQCQMVAILAGCTFLPGSFDKRFVKDMASRSRQYPAPPLTEKQDETLTAMFHRYRRQHKVCRCAICQAEKGGKR